jgi:tol-pal system protein YbgF
VHILRLIAYILAPLVLFGCAGIEKTEDSYGRLERRIEEQRVLQEETLSRLEELNNKFILLHEKVEAEKAVLRRLLDVPVEPPHGLKVVRLGEEEEVEVPVERVTPVARAGQSAEILYGRGQDLFMSGRYGEARSVFMEFLRSFPAHGLADNALYWLGESYYSEQDYERALEWFAEAAGKYPGGNKAPDALLKVGYSYIELDLIANAQEALGELLDRYPDSEAAVSAGKALEKVSGLKKEGAK